MVVYHALTEHGAPTGLSSLLNDLGRLYRRLSNNASYWLDWRIVAKRCGLCNLVRRRRPFALLKVKFQRSAVFNDLVL